MIERIHNRGVAVPNRYRAAVGRAVALFGLWLVISGVGLGDVPAGLAAAAIATWTSLRLLPPGRWQLRPLALAKFVLRFVRHSAVAGTDVALRALDPRDRLHPGLVRCAVGLPPGPARSAFCMVSSLLPGAVPAGFDASGRMLVHCLDTRQPVADELAAEEARMTRALGWGGDD